MLCVESLVDATAAISKMTTFKEIQNLPWELYECSPAETRLTVYRQSLVKALRVIWGSQDGAKRVIDDS